jgi:hypothetical protein
MAQSNIFGNSSGVTPLPPPSSIYSASSSSVYQQIEGTANYYQPNVYELLTFYSALSTQSDELDGQFIPLTDVQPTTAQQTLIFAVGILPPSSQVTGKLLDRSATIAQTAPLNTANLDPKTGQARSTAASIPPSAGPKTTTSTNPMAQFVCMCNRLGWQPEQLAQVLYSESGFNPAAQNPGISSVTGVSVAMGLNQIQGSNGPGGGFAGSTAEGVGLTQQQYASFSTLSVSQQLPYVEKYFKNCGGAVPGLTAAQIYALNLRPSGLNSDGTIYNSSIPGQASLVSGNPGCVVNVGGVNCITPESLASRLSPLPQNLQAQINAARTELGMTNPQPTVGTNANPANSYQAVGSPNANAAQAAISTYANSNLNTSNLGQQFMSAQQYMINATLQAIQRMQATPPLKMLVNPQSFKVSLEKIISDGEWSREGPIVEHWGEQLDKIEASGKVAAFYSANASQTMSSFPGVGTGPGLTRVARQYSTAYQNFLSLWLLYKNNGGVWLADYVNSGSTTQSSTLSVLGSIYIYYDNILYLGSFDNFSLTESETAPFTLDYSFTFTVRATFLLDNTDDLSLSLTSLAESQNYGVTYQAPSVMTTNPIVNQQPAGAVRQAQGQQSAALAASLPTGGV